MVDQQLCGNVSVLLNSIRFQQFIITKYIHTIMEWNVTSHMKLKIVTK